MNQLKAGAALSYVAVAMVLVTVASFLLNFRL